MYKPQISPIDAQNSPLLVNLPPPKADADHDARMMSSLAAALRRICMLKPASGKLEVSQEIHRQFKAGGQQRKCLLDMLVKSKGNKDQCCLLSPCFGFNFIIEHPI